MPTLGQALQNRPEPEPRPGIRTVVTATSATIDVGWGAIANATGVTPAAGRRVVVVQCDGAVWVAVALLPT